MQDPTKERLRVTEHEGRYSNYFKIGFNSYEFIVDFGQRYTGGGVELQQSRIITSPVYAKALSALLNESLAAYERTYGAITEIGRRDDADIKEGNS